MSNFMLTGPVVEFGMFLILVLIYVAGTAYLLEELARVFNNPISDKTMGFIRRVVCICFGSAFIVSGFVFFAFFYAMLMSM